MYYWVLIIRNDGLQAKTFNNSNYYYDERTFGYKMDNPCKKMTNSETVIINQSVELLLIQII